MLLARARRTIRERTLLDGGETVLVAVSGGPDSAALLDVLARLSGELRLTLHAASVNHGLREDAARDVEVARELAARLEVPFHALRVEVGEGSVQAAARDARYAALRQTAGAVGASRIAVGHTLDDQAETVLFRLLRGARVAGLGGIVPRREDGVIRPLLDCRREQVRAHVDRFELPHVEDPANVDERFTRARVRHAVLPALVEESAAIVEHLARLADEARAIADWIDEDARALVPSSGDSRLRRESVVGAPAPVREAVIGHWIGAVLGAAPKHAHVRSVDRLRAGGVVPIGGEWVVRLEEGDWVARREPDHRTRSTTSQTPDTE